VLVSAELIQQLPPRRDAAQNDIHDQQIGEFGINQLLRLVRRTGAQAAMPFRVQKLFYERRYCVVILDDNYHAGPRGGRYALHQVTSPGAK